MTMALVGHAAHMPPPMRAAAIQPNEAYEVYSEILRMHKAEWNWARCAIQRESTLANMGVGCARPKHNQQRYASELRDFAKRAPKSILLDAKFDATLNCELISELQAKQAFLAMSTPPPPPGTKPREPKQEPPLPPYRHILEFSAVGFNEARDRAIVYAGGTCGGLCGSGAIIALQKINGKWQIDKSYEPSCPGWVS